MRRRTPSRRGSCSCCSKRTAPPARERGRRASRREANRGCAARRKDSPRGVRRQERTGGTGSVSTNGSMVRRAGGARINRAARDGHADRGEDARANQGLAHGAHGRHPRRRKSGRGASFGSLCNQDFPAARAQARRLGSRRKGFRGRSSRRNR